MKSALFLGAGASVFASHPTTATLLEMVAIRVAGENRNLSPLIDSVLSHFDMPDIEKVYDFIYYVDGFRHHPNMDVANNLMYRAKDNMVSYPDMIDELGELKRAIRDVLLQEFAIRHIDNDVIKDMYDKILSVMKGHESGTFQVITTNYDRVIERYCEVSDWELVDGFSSTPNGDGRIWSGKWVSTTDKPPLHLTKLHGSVTWQKDGDDIIDQRIVGMRDEGDDIMILPTLGPKEYVEPPFRELMPRFNRIMEDLDMLVVVGFSYRDPEINRIIKRRLDDGMTLVTISTNTYAMNHLADTHRDPIERSIGGIPVQQYRHLGANAYGYLSEFDPDTIDDVVNVLDAIYKKRHKVGSS